jgi:hypothetical protein
MPVLVVGSIAIDSIKTQLEERRDVLGGASAEPRLYYRSLQNSSGQQEAFAAGGLARKYGSLQSISGFRGEQVQS